MGHSEAVSGQVGMLKVQQVLQNGTAMGNSHLRVLNPLVGSRLGGEYARFGLPTQRLGLARDAAHSPAGLSSFGYSGTIAHTASTWPSPNPVVPLASAFALKFTRLTFSWLGRGALHAEPLRMYSIFWAQEPTPFLPS